MRVFRRTAPPLKLIWRRAWSASIDSGTLLRCARERSPASELIVLGICEHHEQEIVPCAEVGVARYHLRSESLQKLLQLVHSVAAGETLCSPRITALLMRRLSSLASQQRPAERVPAPTAREIQILGLVDEGLSNREIAVCVEVYTVKNHVHSVLCKLGVRRRGDAAAARHGAGVLPTV
jgi:DNA-binding NarL/FixJ family response regulator